uniref:RanBP2-type domain-containing protein n=1 Tax=Timema cristinae TaxID=61476 RepID=A0A7R9CR60_TIMCR|nr:unnamed protein product [Timema cristinae]
MAAKKPLLAQQLERRNKLRRELQREKLKLHRMQREKNSMQRDLEHRELIKRKSSSLAFPIVTTVVSLYHTPTSSTSNLFFPIITTVKVQHLRQEIQWLQDECKMMTTEVDLTSSDSRDDISLTKYSISQKTKTFNCEQKITELLDTTDVALTKQGVEERKCSGVPYQCVTVKLMCQLRLCASAECVGTMGVAMPGVVPLGETDEEFYKNIYTGQRCRIMPARSHMAYHPRRPFPRGSPPEEGPNWTCSKCTFRNHPLLDKCEECNMPRILLGTAPPGDFPIISPCYCHPKGIHPLTRMTLNGTKD